MAAGTTPREPLPYVEITDEDYGRRAADEFTVEEVHSGTLILRGPCPRCRASLEIPVVSTIVHHRSFGRHLRRVHRPRAADQVEPMMCTCEDDHPNRPNGHYGCGAYWTVVIPARTS
ncbi:hypothetical protein JCM4814A_92740 [Streptomyces phaeofaciens JCM 4814]|uniref:Uncharacterized protein n=1 Tax=Streptomyces phaeofaciens TaxID=68254 RepID=A0A918HL84_9ACTN|nr:hypothetical protein [Streptomyces phaeofaciens]GGT70965.1 hypothetical protein GCM10010226_56080 [Streptomyces phaeofaciens]